MIEWRERAVRVADVTFHVRAAGAGDELVLLLHGWPQSGHAWRLVADELVRKGYRVAAPDLKGFGRSVGSHDFSPETLADEVSQLIRALGVRRAIVVGHDWGGAVALATAFRHQGLVQGLVLVSAPYRHLDLTRAFHIPLFNLPVLPQLAFRAAAAPLVRAALAIGVDRRSAYGEPDIAAYVEAVSAQPRAWLGYYRQLSRASVRDLLVRRARRALPLLSDPPPVHRLRTPTVVVWGARDRVTPLVLGERVSRDLHATLVVADRAGHLVPEESPHDVVRAVDVVRSPVRLAANG